MKIYFSISELCIEDKDVSLDVADKLLEHHITPMNVVRDKLDNSITASGNSGYRSVQYELNHNRGGTSQHCFLDKGAIDWTTHLNKIKRMIELIIEHTKYLRICYYPNNGFVHCDYKDVDDGKRRYYECSSPTSSWQFKKYV